MTNPWDNCLTMGRPVDAGQLYDIRGDGLINRFVTQCDVFDKSQNNEFYDSKLVNRKNSDDVIPKLLGISKNQLLREICYPNPYGNGVIEFLFPSAQKYILICYERLTQVKWIGRYNEVIMDASHIVSRIDCGSIVWIRIIPDNEEIQIGSLYETYKNGMKLNPMFEANCKIESLTNWKDRKSHASVNEATQYAECQMKSFSVCPIRYVLNRLTSNALWQQNDDAVIPVLKNLIRLETAKNSISEMLHKMNIKASNEALMPLPSTLEEKLIANIKSNKFFKFKNLKQHEFLTTVIDMFTQVCRLQLLCFKYIRERYSSIAMPRPFITNVLNMSLILLEFGNEIHKICDENFLQQRQGIFYYNLCTTCQEESLTTSNSNFLLINEERNLDSILKYSLKWQKHCFLVGFLSGPPKTRFLAKAISNKDEKVFLHINSAFKCLGIAVPSNDIRAVLPNTLELFMAKCQCNSAEIRIWICEDCNEFLYNGQGKRPNCRCGKEDFHKMGVKCFNEFHGNEYYSGRDKKSNGFLPNMCFPSTSSKKDWNDKKEDSIEDSYEPAENLDAQKNSYSVDIPTTSSSSSAIKALLNVKINDTLKLNSDSTSVESFEDEQKVKPISVTHSYNLRSKNNNITKDEEINNHSTTEHQKQRSKIYVDKTVFLKTSETDNTKDIPKLTIKIKPLTTTLPLEDQCQNIQNKEYVKSINIAVIGQSGVGKSTLLNAIANYLKYETAQDALNNDLEYIIPCQFKVFYDDFSERLVSIGMPDNNELYEDATVLSTTQECKEHSFEFGGFKINFIDTPGLSDTSGVEKDVQNLEKIRSFICSSLDSLHAICFVVKANEGRMDIGFSNSMNDLLSIFPKSALSKVIFFMTHSRGTLYGPGDTMTPLNTVSQNLLKTKGVTFPLTSDNIFCVDNESFLYLCAKNQGIEYSGASFEDFESSWKKSKQATQRFFDKVKNMEAIKIMYVEIIKDFADVLFEQKQILSKHPNSTNWLNHFLTAKMLNLIEVGNVSKKYLDFIDMNLIKKEAKLRNVDLQNLTNIRAFQGVPDFIAANKNISLPASQNFVQKYKTNIA